MTLSPLIQRAWATIAASFSRPNLPNAFAILILFFASTQLGLHFWPDSTLVYGIRIDYLAPTLYLLDLLIIIYLVLKKAIIPVALSPLLPILLLNLVFSVNPLATLSWSLHLLLYLMFAFTIPTKLLRDSLLKILPLAILFQVVLGFMQVIKGGALEGVFYLLGERAISLTTPNAAKAVAFGQTTLRAYGTFSHPNTMAGYLVVSFLTLLVLMRTKRVSLNHIFTLSLTAITSLGIFLTHSRSAALALFGLIIPLYFLSRLRSRLIYFAIFLTTSSFLLFPSFLPLSQDSAFTSRAHLQQISQKITRAYPIFGTGAQASISTYRVVAQSTRLLQPDHNSVTLLLSWFGVVGTLALLAFLKRLPLSSRQTLLVFLPLTPLVLLDHYLLTSPQGLLALLLYLRVTINYES